jgi:hypothetical protein
MKRLVILALSLIFAACATGRNPLAPPVTINTPQPATLVDNVQPVAVPSTESSGSLALTGDPQADLANAIQYIRVDTQNALVGATAAKDEVGVQCFVTNLAFLDMVSTPQVTVTGLISKAEALRVKQRAVVNNLSAWYNVRDKCSAVFNLGQVFRPLNAVLGGILPF